jgi:hypothetical protein
VRIETGSDEYRRTAAEWLRIAARPHAPRQECLPHLGDLCGERRRGFIVRQPVIIGERAGKNLEDALMPQLVIDDALKIAQQRRGQRSVVRRQLKDAAPTTRGSSLRIDVRHAERVKRTVVETFADLARHLARDFSGGRHDRRHKPREWRIAPARVLPHRCRPSAHSARDLVHIRVHAEKEVAVAEDRAADVDRVHLLILPRPQQRVAHQLAHVVAEIHPRQPLANDLFAIGNADDFLPLEREQEKLDQLLARRSGKTVAKFPELDLEFFVNRGHGSMSVRRARQDHTHPRARCLTPSHAVFS